VAKNSLFSKVLHLLDRVAIVIRRGMKREMIILKFGGSLITDKKKEIPTINQDNLNRIASILSKHSHQFIIVHGAGSFGHPIAKKFNLANGWNKHPNQKKAIEETREQVLELNQILCNSLNKKEILTKTIIPSKTMKTNGPKNIENIPTEIFDEGLETGKVPVTFGDVTDDNLQGICILSGDVIMEELVKHYKPRMSIFVMDYPGVFDRNPTDKNSQIIPVVTLQTLKMLKEKNTHKNGATDVTGGLIGKLECAMEMAKHSETWITNLDHLDDFLNGNPRGSRVIS
jgi:isopentenyl phosphate kinase